ncbi:hypothetical protein CEXT_540651 [Caerostris extrusa]|uniref:Uncharacterized protein n=1 Tax=Caerostris extrusa TaxID=172846 RepID=A0AAV4XN28_CAEEX|nr:hypothetical protein CEXT_540651 [Caerostris extrusa]
MAINSSKIVLSLNALPVPIKLVPPDRKSATRTTTKTEFLVSASAGERPNYDNYDVGIPNAPKTSDIKITNGKTKRTTSEEEEEEEKNNNNNLNKSNDRTIRKVHVLLRHFDPS